MQANVAATMYRFLTDDLDALDIVIQKNGEIRLYRFDKPIATSPEIRKLLIWAVYRATDHKVLGGFKIS